MKVPRGKPRGIEPAFAPRLACRLKSADSPTSQIKYEKAVWQNARRRWFFEELRS